jgi:hypothetical protein
MLRSESESVVAVSTLDEWLSTSDVGGVHVVTRRRTG